MNYEKFLFDKTSNEHGDGFKPIVIHDFLKDFQKYAVEWSIEKGRSAIYADCGLGKTAMQLSFADNIVKKTNGRVLILTPLSVSDQTVREGDKFGIFVTKSRNGKVGGSGIYVTNYQQLHKFDRSDFVGTICDESSAIKAFAGKLKRQVTQFMAHHKYRLLGTATASPNDFIELGTSSEALGIMGQMDMLNQFFQSTDNMNHAFFKQDDFWNRHKWIFKAHSEKGFWKWVASWALAFRFPSDLGFSDEGYKLPGLKINQHVIKNNFVFDGELFPRVAVGISEQRKERRFSMDTRCDMVADLVNHDDPVVVWGQLNDECDYLEKTIPDAHQIAGRDPDEKKEELLDSFRKGEIRVLVSKPQICGFGLNWQHCNHMTFFPSHSFEQYYQAVRRSYRFGQLREVKVDIVTTEGEAMVTSNLEGKARRADKMFEELISNMGSRRKQIPLPTLPQKGEFPSWLTATS
jgi:hypothetical protein